MYSLNVYKGVGIVVGKTIQLVQVQLYFSVFPFEAALYSYFTTFMCQLTLQLQIKCLYSWTVRELTEQYNKV